LQARILEGLQEQGAFQKLVLLGGTALRFLYGLPRFSEDLDFSTNQPEPDFSFEGYAEKLIRKFQAEGYQVYARHRGRIVASCLLRFPSLLHEMGLSPQPEQTIAIRLEADANPPAGAEIRSTLVRRHVLLNLPHYDQASLLAGKLHAVLSRRFTKGRDLYDLLWFLTDTNWPAPNLRLLNNALQQTGWSGQPLEKGNWRYIIAASLERMNWPEAVKDVLPFLEHPAETEHLTLSNLRQLLIA
jgi:hypothetical protein